MNNSENLLDYKKPFDIKTGLNQKFVNEFDYKKVNENVLIKMKQKNTISERDLEIAKFLFKIRFATLNQIHRYLGCNINKSNLKTRLDKLVTYRVINKFTFVTPDGTKEEQLGFYCLDTGGRHLLAHYSTGGTEDWNTSVNIKAAELVGENLLATELYVRLLETCPDKLTNFEIYPEFRCGEITIKPHFKCTLTIGDKKIHFIGDVNRDYHFPDEFDKKARKLESLLTTNAWRKYYRNEVNPPILLIFSNSDNTVKEAAETIHSLTRLDLKKIRFSTDERIKEALGEKGTFLKYEQTSAIDDSMSLKLAQINIF